ncbi:MAG: polysaccharide biosynthesis tyrosine autokinase [Nakamurella sp.]
MNHSAFIRACRRNWWIVLTAAALGLGIGAVVTVLTPPRYASTVSFFVKTPASEISGAFQGDQFGQRRVKSYVELLESERVAQLIASELGGDVTAQAVKSAISAQADPNTVVVTATVIDGSALRSLAITQSLAGQFVTFVSGLETPSGQSVPSVNLEVTTAPTLNPTPISPRPLLNCGLAFLAGLLLGLILVAAKDKGDTAVRSVETLRLATGLPVLGVIPLDAAARLDSVTALPAAARILDESFRQLRVNLAAIANGPLGAGPLGAVHHGGGSGEGGRSVDPHRGASILAITSSLPEEGRTLTAVRLAIGFANAGWEVLLVDGDLRRPQLADCFALPNSTGLADILTGTVTFTEAVHTRERPRLSVLTSGSPSTDAAELVQAADVATFLASVRRDFQLIVIDTPALLAAADGSVLAAQSDATIHVVRHGRTHTPQVARGLALLDTVGAPVVGCLLNMVPTRGVDGYGFDYGHYAKPVDRPAHDEAPSSAAPSPRRDIPALEKIDEATTPG